MFVTYFSAGLVVYDLDASSAGLVQLFFEQLATELQAASPREGIPKQVLAAVKAL